MLDGKPIVAILTGIGKGSENDKTGTMAQLWIMRADVNPWVAVETGEDRSICGSCVHRLRWIWTDDGKLVHERTCYVNKRTPAQIFRSYEAGRYEYGMPARQFGQGVRFGADGDPAAVPVEILEELASLFDFHTGYTHVWRTRPDLKHLLMASCDNALDALQATIHGWRYFRVDVEDYKLDTGKREVQCVATMTDLQCQDCRLCDGDRDGANVASVRIVVHGNAAKYYGLPTANETWHTVCAGARQCVSLDVETGQCVSASARLCA